MPGRVDYPPFPKDVITHPLLIIDYELIKAGDEGEINKLWKAGTELGFWYLKNHGTDDAVDEMFAMGEETMHLPMDEKAKYEQGDSGMSFGYKAAGANATDASGNLDTVEFVNISKDDALAWPRQVHRSYPSTVNDKMESVIKQFVQKATEVNMTLMEVLNAKLGLPAGTLVERHHLLEPSGSEARVIKNPPLPGGISEEKAALGAHTDFGSLSFLHSRLGGLQVMVPGTDHWQYVKPLPGHAVCNLGDAMTLYSGGILRSNLHRVVPPPKEQSMFELWFVVFFTRPDNKAELGALTELSPMIADAVAKAPEQEKFSPKSTAEEWFARRIKNQRIKNRKGPETWAESRGMEFKPDAA